MEDTTEQAFQELLPVELPVFSGPLDLLLHLIQKDEVSIYDIPILRICDQYHDALRAMTDLDLEVAGEFLWMASWLLHLKSKMLLPRQPEGEEDPRHELVERLLEYRRVKELASMLYEIDVVRRGTWHATLTPELGDDETEVDLEEVDLRLLAYAYLDAMQRHAAANPPPLQVIPLRFKVEDTMREIYEAVKKDGLLPLLRHVNRSSDLEETVVLIVSALELVRLGGVMAEQRRPFAEIYLRPSARDLDPKSFFQQGADDGS